MRPNFSGKLNLTVVPVTADKPKLGGFQELADVWHAKRGDLFLPAREKFDMPSLRPWLGNVNFSVMTEKGPFFTLFGSRNASELNIDLTRQYLIENVYDLEKDRIMAEYEELATTRAIGIFEGMSIIHESGHKTVSVLVLPLSADGESVTGFLHYLRFGYFRRTTPNFE